MVRPTTNGQYLHVAAVTRPSLVAKLKSDENGHVLNVASDALSCFVHVSTFFFKTPLNRELTEKNNQNKQDLTEKAKKIHYEILTIS